MSCDIYAFAERRTQGDKFELIPMARPFSFQNYELFGWLAGVRNVAGLPVVSEPRGVPKDASAEVAAEFDRWIPDAHDASWLAIDELLSIGFDQPVEDRRVMRELAVGVFQCQSTATPGQGTMSTFGKLFGDDFFESVAMLKAVGAARVVFWFVG